MTADALTIVLDPQDATAGSSGVARAVRRLREELARRGSPARLLYRRHLDGSEGTTVVVAGTESPLATVHPGPAGTALPTGPEAMSIVPVRSGPEATLLACGSDARGLVYAVLEIVDRLETGSDPSDLLGLRAPITGAPSNAVRSVTRLFCSEVEDRAWFSDERFWDRYLSMLVSQRFNRFSLTLGLGYNYPWAVTDGYFYFAYPFLVSVPGYDVRVPQLSDEERDRNLAVLRRVSHMAVERGLDFQLGLWTHAYEWIDSPNAHHTISGLTPETHAPYCRDAIGTLLEACPAIGGVTLRIHGESGVPEGTEEFWKQVFDGVAGCGRPVGIDLHAKGLEEQTLQHALETGLPVTVSPKFWAEHMGLPYHQAAIREREREPREDPSHLSEWHRRMKVSEGSRPFTRYGYGDFLREDRDYDIVFRLWAGTQRLLLWGDPVFAAAYGRAAGLAGSGGLEWCEPLTFKGREGTGLAGSRTGYADGELVPDHDWEKYAYAYRLFGRLGYDPEAPPETWRRDLAAGFGAAAADAEAALAAASRILPLVTVAHHPSASNNYYWPEIYTDMPIVWSDEEDVETHYLDTPAPRRFGTVDPLDPEVFAGVSEFVAETLAGSPSGRIIPPEVASLLDRLAEQAERRLSRLQERIPEPDAEARRWIVDAGILAGLGRFFAGKLRAAVEFEWHAHTGSVDSLRRAIEAYRGARNGWATAISLGEGAYVADLTFGPQPWIRGCWSDRLAAIDADLRAMEARWVEAGGTAEDPSDDRPAAPARLGRPRLSHSPPSGFTPGVDLTVDVEFAGPQADAMNAVLLRYRPMNQALSFSAVDMGRSGRRFSATIPGGALDARYPIAYAFVVHDGQGNAWRVPGLGDDLAEQPYYVLRPTTSDPGCHT